MEKIFQALQNELQNGRDAVLGTIIRVQGSTPRGIGAQMLVGAAGLLEGTIGGGNAERCAEELSLTLLQEKRSVSRDFPLHHTEQNDLGMVCGGDITVFFQYIPAASPLWQQIVALTLTKIRENCGGQLILRLDGDLPCLLDVRKEPLLGTAAAETDAIFSLPLSIRQRVIIFGAGHLAEALCRLLDTIDFRVIVYDDRVQSLSPALFPTAEARICGEFADYQKYLTLTAEDYIAVMTADHAHDFILQQQLLRGDFAYLGVIGSRGKHATVNRQLLESGITEAQLSRMHAPIGISIHSVTPEEIAVSIAGEMILVRAERRKSGEKLHLCPTKG